MTGTFASLVERGLMAEDWAEALAPAEPAVEAMGRFLREENAAGRGYLPAGDHVLRAFSRPLAEVKVLIVGQDPYPTPGHPIGLSFSVAPDVRPLPPSLVNIYKELVADLGVDQPSTGDLTPWSDHGVLLLNRCLTVQPGKSAAHRGRGWEKVTDRAIEALASRGGPTGRDPLGPRRAVAQAVPRPDPLGRVGAPVTAVGPGRLLRVAPVQQGELPARAPGRHGRRLAPPLTALVG